MRLSVLNPGLILLLGDAALAARKYNLTMVTLVQHLLMVKGVRYGSLQHHGGHGRTRLCDLRLKTSRVWNELKKSPRHVVISDWNAEPMDILLIMYRDTGIVPWCSNSVVLNVKGRTYCHPKELLEEDMYTNEQVCEPTEGQREVITAQNDEE
ncbi:hypothetical protein NCS56_00917500 [Fusarium sp. Ph1]|nr:hypothetical protein NCS56_00917500 [Fusarium sp. Ph1]